MCVGNAVADIADFCFSGLWLPWVGPPSSSSVSFLSNNSVNRPSMLQRPSEPSFLCVCVFTANNRSPTGTHMTARLSALLRGPTQHRSTPSQQTQLETHCSLGEVTDWSSYGAMMRES